MWDKLIQMLNMLFALVLVIVCTINYDNYIWFHILCVKNTNNECVYVAQSTKARVNINYNISLLHYISIRSWCRS
jgi:hypothetical protein